MSCAPYLNKASAASRLAHTVQMRPNLGKILHCEAQAVYFPMAAACCSSSNGHRSSSGSKAVPVLEFSELSVIFLWPIWLLNRKFHGLCLSLAVTTHFCLTRGSKRLLVGTDWSTIWRWSECQLMVLCINEIVCYYTSQWQWFVVHSSLIDYLAQVI